MWGVQSPQPSPHMSTSAGQLPRLLDRYQSSHGDSRQAHLHYTNNRSLGSEIKQLCSIKIKCGHWSQSIFADLCDDGGNLSSQYFLWQGLSHFSWWRLVQVPLCQSWHWSIEKRKYHKTLEIPPQHSPARPQLLIKSPLRQKFGEERRGGARTGSEENCYNLNPTKRIEREYIWFWLKCWGSVWMKLGLNNTDSRQCFKNTLSIVWRFEWNFPSNSPV